MKNPQMGRRKIQSERQDEDARLLEEFRLAWGDPAAREVAAAKQKAEDESDSKPPEAPNPPRRG